MHVAAQRRRHPQPDRNMNLRGRIMDLLLVLLFAAALAVKAQELSHQVTIGRPPPTMECLSFCRTWVEVEQNARAGGVARLYHGVGNTWGFIEVTLVDDRLVPPDVDIEAHLHVSKCSPNWADVPTEQDLLLFNGNKFLWRLTGGGNSSLRARAVVYEMQVPWPELGAESVVVHDQDDAKHICCTLQKCVPPQDFTCRATCNNWQVDPNGPAANGTFANGMFGNSELWSNGVDSWLYADLTFDPVNRDAEIWKEGFEMSLFEGTPNVLGARWNPTRPLVLGLPGTEYSGHFRMETSYVQNLDLPSTDRPRTLVVSHMSETLATCQLSACAAPKRLVPPPDDASTPPKKLPVTAIVAIAIIVGLVVLGGGGYAFTKMMRNRNYVRQNNNTNAQLEPMLQNQLAPYRHTQPSTSTSTGAQPIHVARYVGVDPVVFGNSWGSDTDFPDAGDIASTMNQTTLEDVDWSMRGGGENPPVPFAGPIVKPGNTKSRPRSLHGGSAASRNKPADRTVRGSSVSTTHAPNGSQADVVPAGQNQSGDIMDRIHDMINQYSRRKHIFYQKYQLLNGDDNRREGGQGVVVFAKYHPTFRKQRQNDANAHIQFAVKFFTTQQLFNAEYAMYQSNDLMGMMPRLFDVYGSPLQGDTEILSPASVDGHTFLVPPFMVMEKGESFEDYNRRGSLDYYSCLPVMMHVGQKLRDLHRVGYAHGDIKPSNIILTQDNSWRLIDFASCRKVGEPGRISCTLAWAAPEVICMLRQGHQMMVTSEKMDVWALGMMMWVMLTNVDPWDDLEQYTVDTVQFQQMMVDRHVGNSQFPWERSPLDPDLVRRLGQLRRTTLNMLDRNPARRPSFEELITTWRSMFQSNQRTMSTYG